MRYKLTAGSSAWIVHRLTGVLLTLYVFVHLYVLSHLKDPVQYEALMGLMKHPLVRLSEVGLLGLVVAHSFNGIRLVLLDLGVPTRLQKKLFWAAVVIGGLLSVFGAIPFVIGGAH
ncbi:MAG: succinate dehydrogenase, cytochrome b556 subunit [Nitrospirota bacterium]